MRFNTHRCSGVSLAAATLSGMINFIHPEYVATTWQTYLFYVAMAFIIGKPIQLWPRFFASRHYRLNSYTSKHLSWTVQIALFCSVLGMSLFLFVPVGMHKHVNPGSYLVNSNPGTSGWNPGTAWMLGIANSMYAFGGTDGGKPLAV